jgi:glucokinase-like ROK family protein
LGNEVLVSEKYSGYPLVENSVQEAIMAHARHAPVSRAELTAKLSSSRGKISMELGRLFDKRILTEDGFADSEGGRRSALLRIPSSAGLIGAVDIGATYIHVALTTLASEVVSRRREPADVERGPQLILGRVKEILSELLDEQGVNAQQVLAIGIGVPGPVEQASGLLTSPGRPGWDRFPIRDMFAGDYAAPVFIDNEVNLMALGERWGGVGKGVDNMIFVKIATGIGSGLIVEGNLYRGTQGCAGDFGHVCVDPNGPICSCGNRGCLEAMAAAPAIVREAEECARKDDSSVLSDILQERGELTAIDVGEAARRSDDCALEIIRRSGRLIGQTIATLVSVLNPSLIIIGGGVSHIGHPFLAEIRSSIYSRSLPLATRNLPIVLSEAGETAGVLGASVLAAEGVLTVPR